MYKKIVAVLCYIITIVLLAIPISASEIEMPNHENWFNYWPDSKSPDEIASKLPRFWGNMKDNPYFDTNEAVKRADTMLTFVDSKIGDVKSAYDFNDLGWYVFNEEFVLTAYGALVYNTVDANRDPCYITGDWTSGTYGAMLTKHLSVKFEVIEGFDRTQIVMWLGYFEPDTSTADASDWTWYQGYKLYFSTLTTAYKRGDLVVRFDRYELITPYADADGNLAWRVSKSGDTLNDFTIFLWQHDEDGYQWGDISEAPWREPSTLSKLSFVKTRHPWAYYWAYEHGYTASYSYAYDDGYVDGHADGKIDGAAEWQDSTDAIFEGVGVIFDAPVRFFATIFDVELFGINIFDVLRFAVAAFVAVYVIKKIINAIKGA